MSENERLSNKAQMLIRDFPEAINEFAEAVYDRLFEKMEMCLLYGENPQGHWEPLGHRPGYLKHPFSEDFRCSVCGYEAYTLFSAPPEKCPRCNADMRDAKQTTIIPAEEDA